MKLSLDSLKSIDWKRVGVDHGEKIVVGLVGLIVLMILALGTRWSAYDAKDPQKIVKTVSSERQELQAATWPVEEQRKHPVDYQVGLVVSREQGPVKLEPYDYPLGHAMSIPLHKKQQRYEEPNWLALEYPESTGGRVYLETGGPEAFGTEGMLAGADGLEGAEGADGQLGLFSDGPDPSNPFRNQAGAGGAGEAMFGPGGAFAPGAPGGAGGHGESGHGESGPGGPGPGAPGPPGPGGGGHGEDGPMGEFPGMGPEGMAVTYPQVEGQSYRYASIRYVFPWKQQVELIAKGRHTSDPQEYANILAKFRIVDFELQRQEAQPGPQPWSDENWVTVNREMAMNALREVATFEMDIVDTSSIDPVITMPLPARLDRRWIVSEAGHEQVHMLTSEEEIARQRLLAEALLQQQREMEPPENIVRLGGFYNLQADLSGARMALQGDVGARRSFISNFRKEAGNDMFAPGQFDSIEGSLASIPEYLLFRYFDFDVRPGVAYRYRARVTLTNPNFGASLQLVSRPEISQGKTRTTPWSKPTPPAIVPPDVDVYLENIQVDRGVSKAQMKIIQWLPEVGTPVTKTIPITPGSRIYERSTTEVIEPGVTLEEREVAFAAPTVVVDAEAGPAEASSRSFHADLKLPPTANGQLEMVEQTLVVNESGELEVLTPFTNEAKEQKQEGYIAGLLEYHKPLRPATMATTDDMGMGGGEGLDFLAGGEGSEAAMKPRGRGRYANRRSRSPLDRRGGGDAHSGGGDGGSHSGP